jgi:beta-mannosidase
MAISWCFNDCWPSAANTSIIEYPSIPKKAYYSVQNACRTILASARIRKFVWDSGEEFEADLFILNDSLQEITKSMLNAYLKIGKNRLKIFEWYYPQGEEQANITGPTIKFILPKLQTDRFFLQLEDINCAEINSEYMLLSANKNIR